MPRSKKPTPKPLHAGHIAYALDVCDVENEDADGRIAACTLARFWWGGPVPCDDARALTEDRLPANRAALDWYPPTVATIADDGLPF